MNVRPSKVLQELPPYLFSRIDRMIGEKRRTGADVISLGIGDPDLPTPPNILEALKAATKRPENYQYPSYEGKINFRRAVAAFYKRKWGVDLNPETEIVASIGAKEAIHNASFAFQEGMAIVPNPGYTVYASGAKFAGRKVLEFPLIKQNRFLPDTYAIGNFARDAAYMWLNYPNNPTAATIEKNELKRIVHFCRDSNTILLYDNTYSEMAYDNYKAPSPLEFGKEGIVEFHSLSKTYSMTGFRIGWIAGDEKLVQMILSVKKNIDSGVANVIQDAAIEALTGPQDTAKHYVEVYRNRRDMLIHGLTSLGIKAEKPKATFYVWAEVPEKFKNEAMGHTEKSPSMAYCEHLLGKAGVVCTPGVGFGKYGEGFVRFALTQPEDRISEAINRIGRV